MSFKIRGLAVLTAATIAFPVLAGETSGIMIEDPYARVSTAASTSGAAFLMIMNHGETDDRLTGVSTGVAARAELHTHQEDSNGVMKMMHVEEGFAVSAGDMRLLQRGGDHIMLMGLNRALAHGDVISITLTFEEAGDVSIDVPVDLERKPGVHGTMEHMAPEADD